MIKRLLTIALLAAGAACGASAAEPVLTGTLPNGLTYYIMRNASPAGQADFFLAQRVGSVQEKENERGLAHFLEHIAFNGSEHFPGNSLISYLESHGVKFGADLNAYTSTDETVYNISRVPSSSEATLDSCLLILRDWSCGLTLADADIDAERGVITGEYRHRSSASNRILESMLPQLYPGSPYGRRMPMGLMSVVENFKPHALREFYRRWHSPANQAVIAVGDFDPVRMRDRLVALFSPIPNPKGSKSVKEAKVPDNRKMIVAVGTDPEQSRSVLQLHFKYREPALTGRDYWRHEAEKELLATMLAARFDSVEARSDSPYSSLGVGFGKYLVSRPVSSLMFRGMPVSGHEADALRVWYGEVKRALDHGFTYEELERARSEFDSSLRNRRREAATLSNTRYGRRWVRHFLDGGPLISAEAEIDSLQRAVTDIDLQNVDCLLSDVVSPDGRNVVVISWQPGDKGAAVVSSAALEAAFREVNATDFPPYSAPKADGPLLTEEPARGRILSTDTLPDFNARVYTLSNGIKVFGRRSGLKEGEFLMEGSGPGGLSQRYHPGIAAEMNMLGEAAATFRFGNFSAARLRRRLADIDIKVSVEVEKTRETVQLAASSSSLEDGFRTLWLRMTGAAADPEAFEAWRAAAADRLRTQYRNPVQQMGDSIYRNVYSHHPLGAKSTVAMVETLRLDTLVDIYNDRFADCSDFSFYATGDFTWKRFEDLMERYIASLPAAGRMERPRDIGLRYTPGHVRVKFRCPMETPQAIVYSFRHGPAEYDIPGNVTARAAGQILKDRLLADLREARGWTYSITGHCGINPELNGEEGPSFIWPTYIKVAPEHAAETAEALREAYILLASEGPSAAEIEKVKEYMLKNMAAGEQENSYWLSLLRAYDRYGLNYVANYRKAVESLTPEAVRLFAGKALGADCVDITLMPAEK